MSGITEQSRVLRAFVEAHIDGWDHEDWVGFLRHLGESGHDVSDADGLGLALEQERIRAVLRRSGIKGLGPKRIEAISTGYGNLHQLRSVEASHIVETTGIPVGLAQEVSKILR